MCYCFQYEHREDIISCNSILLYDVQMKDEVFDTHIMVANEAFPIKQGCEDVTASVYGYELSVSTAFTY